MHSHPKSEAPTPPTPLAGYPWAAAWAVSRCGGLRPGWKRKLGTSQRLGECRWTPSPGTVCAAKTLVGGKGQPNVCSRVAPYARCYTTTRSRQHLCYSRDTKLWSALGQSDQSNRVPGHVSPSHRAPVCVAPTPLLSWVTQSECSLLLNPTPASLSLSINNNNNGVLCPLRTIL